MTSTTEINKENSRFRIVEINVFSLDGVTHLDYIKYLHPMFSYSSLGLFNNSGLVYIPEVNKIGLLSPHLHNTRMFLLYYDIPKWGDGMVRMLNREVSSRHTTKSNRLSNYITVMSDPVEIPLI